MFENILGHKQIIQKLNETIKNDIPSHAYVFYGKEGVGKCVVAKEFAKGLLATSNLQNNIDFKYITRYEDKQNILVEQIRENIIEDVYISPAMGKYKVYIIDEADKMNVTAQNTLLKTLEEPPKSVVIILVTSNIDGIIGTVLSRTNNIFFENLSEADMKKYIEENNININDTILQFSDGSLSTLLLMADDSKKEEFNKVDNLFEVLKTKDIVKLLDVMKEIDFKNDLIIKYIEFLMLKFKLYNKIPLMEEIKRAILVNANEDMQKTKLAIKLIRDEV